MQRRRRFMLDTMASALSTVPLAAHAATVPTFDDAARATWRHTVTPLAEKSALQRELVRYATLAPSSHNTQCWK